ncbi:MAG: class I SAM-dependent methyltransferase [Patescibacteria group bacterium]
MKNFDIKNWYNKNIDKYANNLSASFLAKEELNLFTKYIPHGSKILDVGSGLGQDTEYLSKKGYITVGIDFSKEMIKYSLDKRKAGIFINVDFFKIGSILGGNIFGGLWAASSVLTHINKSGLKIFFKEAKRLLLPGGILGVIVRKDKPKNTNLLFNNFSKNEIEALLVGSGFKLIKTREFKVGKAIWFFLISKKHVG